MYLSMEFKRSMHNMFIAVFLILNVAAVGLGYILLVALDKVSVVTASVLAESVYTVYTQFGLFFFAPLFIYTVSGDYKDKTIAFYRTLKYIPLTYFIQKLLFIFICSVIGALISSVLVYAPYGDCTVLPFFFLKVLSVITFFGIATLFLAFMSGKFIVAFFTAVILWITGIIISQAAAPLRYFAYYDAVAQDYETFIHFLRGELPAHNIALHITHNVIFNTAVLTVSLLAVSLCKKQWIKNGTH